MHVLCYDSRAQLWLTAMLTTLAISNYRSLRELIVPLGRLSVITGSNGSGKSSLYRALRLLANRHKAGSTPRWRERADCSPRFGLDPNLFRG